MSERVAAAIRAAIAEEGPIGFDRFMELALYGPGGFYEDPPVGPSGDFVTSPHAHAVFGRLLARAIREAWDGLGRPEPFPLVEVGAGDGTLARQLLGELEEVALRYVAVERSPGGRRLLEDVGDGIEVAHDLEEVGRIERGIVLANELLDNLPFRRVRASPEGLREIHVDVDEAGGFRAVEAPAGAELAALAPSVGPGEQAVVPVGALAFVDRLAETLASGWALLIDYGQEGPTVGEDAVHGYRGHRVVADLLEDPGETDITAGVDLTAVAGRARERGLVVHEPVAQHRALAALGFAEWMQAELDRQGELLRTGGGVEAVRIWSDRSRAALLVDPVGLGRLRWLVLRTHDAPEPPWLGRAIREAAGP